jgi:hypothetical protein
MPAHLLLTVQYDIRELLQFIQFKKICGNYSVDMDMDVAGTYINKLNVLMF